MSQNSILLKNGTVLQHDEQDNVCVLHNTDILITGNRIAQIGQNLATSSNADVIDCTDKIVSPGFVDSHHHMWQTQLKGRHGDHTLMDYVTAANLQAINFSPEDIFWGQLAGCMESLDAGTTCVVDNAHMSAGPDHGSAALAATVASGIRSVFCYGATPLRAAEWTSTNFEVDKSGALPAWILDQLEGFAQRAPFGGDGRVTLGFFFDSYFLPQDVIVSVFERVRKMGIKMITSHFRHWAVSEGQSKIPEFLQSASLLGPDILLSHGNGATPSQASLLTSAGAYIASTPDAEIFMASGADPIAFRTDLPLTSLGADCHTCGPAGMLYQAQTALGSDRASQMREAASNNKYPGQFRAKVQRAFNLITINGARAAQLDGLIGSIAVGKLADLVVFDASTPAMVCAAQQDPLAALVRHAGPREVSYVIVGGEIRKQNGVLQKVNIAHGRDIFPVDEEELSWKEIACRLVHSREQLQKRIEGVNIDLARRTILSMFGKSEEELFA
ncbi:hypothetical protein PISL3812_00765 [Talaromyces islandicus]|uniref:Amidohydrolase-related domain-containing protein n=1 Tax=Talaromyces islandicus TaxID=28573 RepID=A0A0U1LK64_TALIS|nr:hypothetical protein PISL3812_00765 [Talaromyces islandicus]